MSTKPKHNLLSAEHFHAVGAEITQQTIEESQIEYSVDMGGFTIHYATRNGAPIVIVEQHNQKANQLSGIWYDEK